MKKWLLFLALGVFSNIHADEAREEKIIFNFELRDIHNFHENHALYILSDGSCWKAIKIQKRWRGPFEWWNEKELFPEQYLGRPETWLVNSKILISSKPEVMEISFADADNKRALESSKHLFYNENLDQYLFALPFVGYKMTDNRIHNIAHLAALAFECGINSARAGEKPSAPHTIHVSEDAVEVFGLKRAPSDYDEGFVLLTARVTPQENETEGYFVLSDETCWKVYGAKGESLPSDWGVATQFTIFPKEKFPAVFNHFCSLEEKIESCTHLFYNGETQKTLFAERVDPSECIADVFNYAFKKGYNCSLWGFCSSASIRKEFDYLRYNKAELKKEPR